MATVKSTNTDYNIVVRNGLGTLTVNGELRVLGNITYEGNITTIDPFILVGNNNPGPPSGYGNLGMLAQYGNAFAGLRFSVDANAWQISPSVDAYGANIAPYENILTGSSGYSNAEVVAYLGDPLNQLANVFFGNVQANGTIRANGNLTVANISTSNIFSTGPITISTGFSSNVTINPQGLAVVDVSESRVSNALAPTRAFDLATKFYTDTVVSSVVPLTPCNFATDSQLPDFTYDNGGSGIGATITGISAGELYIDGIQVTSGQRILVKNEVSAPATNGIYVVTDAGSLSAPYVLTRAADFNQPAEIPGAVVYVSQGSINRGTAWQCSSTAPVTIGTTAITFETFVPKGTLPGNGLVKSGAVMSVYQDPAYMTFTNIGGSNALTLLSNISFNSIGVGTSAPGTAGQILASDSITAFSDARLKTNVQTITEALEKVRKLRGVTFDKDGKAGIGVIAQEVQEIIPEVVQENNGGILSVAYANLVGLLIEAVKDLDKENAELKSLIAEIQQKLS